jgi:hypothetical protein
MFPSAALKITWRTSKCGHSTSIGLQIITGNVDMTNIVLFLKMRECLHKWRAIICDNLAECAPMAQDILENPIGQGLCILAAK